MIDTTWRRILLLAALALGVLVSGCVSSNKMARQEATAHWQKVRTDVTRQMAQQQLEKGQLEQAHGTLRDALALNPNDAPLHLLMARVLFEQRDMNGAQAEVACAQRLAADLAEADYWQGVLAQAAGLWDEAHTAYQVACAKNQGSQEYLYALLEMKLAMGRCQEAAELAAGRFRDFPRDARLRALAGGALLMKGDLPQAEALYEQALNLDPASEEIRERLAQMLCQAGKYEQAATLLEALLQQEGAARSDLRLLLATCYTRSGRHEAAVKTYEACAAESADCAAVQLRLQEARLLAGQVERARQELNTLLEQRPKDPKAWELLGHACVLAGEFEPAQQAYVHAMECGGEASRLQEYVQAIREHGRTAAVRAPARAMAALGVEDDARAVKRTSDESDR